jgi:hypothetical protein
VVAAADAVVVVVAAAAAVSFRDVNDFARLCRDGGGAGRHNKLAVQVLALPCQAGRRCVAASEYQYQGVAALRRPGGK